MVRYAVSKESHPPPFPPSFKRREGEWADGSRNLGGGGGSKFCAVKERMRFAAGDSLDGA